MLRQYKMITGKNEKGKLESSMNGSSKPSYKDMRKVHTIILFEDSNKSLISQVDKALYFMLERHNLILESRLNYCRILYW